MCVRSCQRGRVSSPRVSLVIMVRSLSLCSRLNASMLFVSSGCSWYLTSYADVVDGCLRMMSTSPRCVSQYPVSLRTRRWLCATVSARSPSSVFSRVQNAWSPAYNFGRFLYVFNVLSSNRLLFVRRKPVSRCLRIFGRSCTVRRGRVQACYSSPCSRARW